MFGVTVGALAQDSGGRATLFLTPTASPEAPMRAAVPMAALSNRATPGSPSAALPPAAPEPAPLWRMGFRENNSWQLSMGYAYVRFRSPQVDVGLHGVNTMLAKYFNEWFGLEGEVTAAFGPLIPGGGRTKYAFYGGGPRIAARNSWRIEPWIHAVAGGTYVEPQVAGGPRSGFAVEAGGGVDWRLRPPLAIRLEGDWTHTRVYGGSQNNFQVVTGLVVNF